VNGAQALIRTLVGCGVDTCFMNPGTSEMHFVAALDDVHEMRGVLALYEGVATGAADGYGRMTDRPAAVLLHLGPGLGNGLANLHNARKAHTPVVNIVGDHATYHKQYDAQLESDIETVARNVSGFIRWSAKTGEVGSDAADTVAAAFGPPGQVATLVLPADISWGDGGEPAPRKPPATRATVADDTVRSIATALRSGEPAMLLVGGTALRSPALLLARAIADATGAKLWA
jgi:acetolactate synthase I/II/III large subunit